MRSGEVQTCVGEGKAQGLSASADGDSLFVATWGRFEPDVRGRLLEISLRGPFEVRREVETEASLAELFYDTHVDRIFGFTDEAIAEIRKAGRPLRSITFHAPRSGIVMDKPALAGMRFGSGDTLFRTADLSSLWVIAQVPERQLASIRPGQIARVTVRAWPNEVYEGRVALIYPELSMATRTVPVRIELPNPDARLDLSALMEGKASDPSAWAAPFTIDGRATLGLVEVSDGHFVRADPRAAGMLLSPGREMTRA